MDQRCIHDRVEFPFDKLNVAYGCDDQVLFPFEAYVFSGKTESVTLYPIPAEISQDFLKLFLQEKLKIGSWVCCVGKTQADYKPTKKWLHTCG